MHAHASEGVVKKLTFEFPTAGDAELFDEDVAADSTKRTHRVVDVFLDDPTDLELEDARNLAREFRGRESKS